MRLLVEGERNLCLRSRLYALRVIRLYESLPQSKLAQVMGLQVLRSGTSIGAHLAESDRAKSPADFVSMIDGALEEASESLYWMRLLVEGGIVPARKLQKLMDETEELIAVLVTVARKTRRSMAK